MAAGAPATAATSAPPAPRVRGRRAGRVGSVAAIVVIVLAIAVPMFVTKGYDLSRLQLTFVYLMAAMSLNFAYGFAGQLALGQPILVGGAAYVAGILSVRHGWTLQQTILPALVAAAVISILIGLPSVRVRGWYFAVLTFFAVLVFPEVLISYRSWTGGEDGLIGIAPIEWAGERWSIGRQYEIVLAATLITTLIIRNAVKSGWGLALQLMRDHPTAAEGSGLSLPRRS